MRSSAPSKELWMSGDGGRVEQNQWQTLVDLWPGYVLTLDAGNRITSLNQSTHRIDASRDLGRDFFDFVSPELEAPFREDLAAARNGVAAVVRRARTTLLDGRF